jgi:hypothetical protein
MSVYFPGTRMEGPFQAKLGRNMVEYQYTERLNQDRSHTVRCGQSSKLVFSLTIGTSRSESEAFKDFVEGSLGSSAFASFKSHVESTVNTEFTVSRSTTETHEFNCPAPPCGRQTNTLYQLVRDYDFTLTKQRRLWGPVTKSAGVRDIPDNSICASKPMKKTHNARAGDALRSDRRPIGSPRCTIFEVGGTNGVFLVREPASRTLSRTRHAD